MKRKKTKMDELFDDGSSLPYVELPKEANRLKWVRGNPQLRAVAKDDPAQYLGGWRAKVSLSATSERGEVILPPLPLPVVTRQSADGSNEFSVYATPWVAFLPMTHRTRWEKKVKARDAMGREVDKIEYWQAKQEKGLTPNRQVFGLVYGDDGSCLPGLITLENWSAFISFQRAGEQWKKVVVPQGKLLVKKYGTMGKKQKNQSGQTITVPNMEAVGQGMATPIEAIGLDKPLFVERTPELEVLARAAQAWAKCERWLNGVNAGAMAPAEVAQAVPAANGHYDDYLEPDLAQPVDEIPF